MNWTVAEVIKVGVSISIHNTKYLFMFVLFEKI